MQRDNKFTQWLPFIQSNNTHELHHNKATWDILINGKYHCYIKFCFILGNFGVVYVGELINGGEVQKVAVKTLEGMCMYIGFKF